VEAMIRRTGRPSVSEVGDMGGGHDGRSSGIC
jgi:hypothetical protein